MGTGSIERAQASSVASDVITDKLFSSRAEKSVFLIFGADPRGRGDGSDALRLVFLLAVRPLNGERNKENASVFTSELVASLALASSLKRPTRFLIEC